VHGFGQSLERQGRNGIDVLSRHYATLKHHHAADVLRWPFGKQSCPGKQSDCRRNHRGKSSRSTNYSQEPRWESFSRYRQQR
jgi:hypothetical protein